MVQSLRDLPVVLLLHLRLSPLVLCGASLNPLITLIVWDFSLTVLLNKLSECLKEALPE